MIKRTGQINMREGSYLILECICSGPAQSGHGGRTVRASYLHVESPLLRCFGLISLKTPVLVTIVSRLQFLRWEFKSKDRLKERITLPKIFNLCEIVSLIIIMVIAQSCSRNQLTDTDQVRTENKMYVYSNYGNTFYLVNSKTFEIVSEIQLNVPDSISCSGVCLSTNRDYLFFQAQGPSPSPPFGFAIYDIRKDKLRSVFFTQFKGVGYPYFVSAQNATLPGLIYTYLRDFGTYSVDLFAQEVIELVSDVRDFDLTEKVFYSPDGRWTVVDKTWESNASGGFSQLEFYTATSGLHDLQFILNERNRDSIYVYDLQFSNGNGLYLSFQLSGGRSRGTESYLGYYDLGSKQLYRSALRFPWSLSGYYLAYSPNRHEIYVVGSNDQFYTVSADDFSIKGTIALPGKVPGPSQILIRPDNDVALVSCPDSNVIYVVDLSSLQVRGEIQMKTPYVMIIP
jgi:hypothetical protein